VNDELEKTGEKQTWSSRRTFPALSKGTETTIRNSSHDGRWLDQD